MIKALDFYYKEKNKLNFFLLINIYLFNIETTKIIYIISYFQEIVFNQVKTYIDNFITYKTSESKVIIIAKIITQEIFINYKRFKKNI
jgi:hypothetical protein